MKANFQKIFLIVIQLLQPLSILLLLFLKSTCLVVIINLPITFEIILLKLAIKDKNNMSHTYNQYK